MLQRTTREGRACISASRGRKRHYKSCREVEHNLRTWKSNTVDNKHYFNALQDVVACCSVMLSTCKVRNI
jgi:hypothetical protein